MRRDWLAWLARAIIVAGGGAGIALFACIGDASGWHGGFSSYYTVPLAECLTNRFPLYLAGFAVFVAVLLWKAERK